MKSVVTLAVLLACAGFSNPALGQTWPPPTEQAKLTASDPAALDRFGASVAVSGDTAIVGTYPEDQSAAGSAYVFVRNGASWSEQAKLTASDGQAGDNFGIRVAAFGDTVVVGAPTDDNAGGTNSGAVYVFVRAGTSWTEQAKLSAADATPYAVFGSSVSLSEETAVIGAALENHAGPGSGAAYAFVRNGTEWTQQAKLTASDAAAGDEFGSSVALSQDTAVVGALVDTNPGGLQAGSAYIFVRAGTIWTQQAKLTALDASPGDLFGSGVAVSGDTAVVGADEDDGGGGMYSGSAYVFLRSGVSWTQQAKLTASDAAPFDAFGLSVGITGDTAVVGASQHGVGATFDHAGEFYVFNRNGTTWSQQSALTAPDAAPMDSFGVSVAIDGDTVVVGTAFGDSAAVADSGAAYVFKLGTIGTWTNLGLGMAGTAGVPTLTGTGYLTSGSPITLALVHAKVFSIAPLVVGVSSIAAPFKGGVMVPTPDFIFPLFADFLGTAAFGGVWPVGVPSGFSTYFQWWVHDPAGPKGFAASNALAGTTP